MQPFIWNMCLPLLFATVDGRAGNLVDWAGFFSTEHQTGRNLTRFGIERTVQMAFLVLNGRLKI
jgi:hypothetical protein